MTKLLSTVFLVVLFISMPDDAPQAKNTYFVNALWELTPLEHPVTVHVLDDDEFIRVKARYVKNGVPMSAKIFAVWYETENGPTNCHIYMTPTSFSAVGFLHELRHCQEGRFHD